jgi:hypothetical protein
MVDYVGGAIGGSSRSTGDSCRDQVQSQIYALYAKYGNKFSLDHLHQYSKPDSIWTLTQNCYNSYGLVAYGTNRPAGLVLEGNNMSLTPRAPGTWRVPPNFGAAAGKPIVEGNNVSLTQMARGTNGMQFW